MAEARQAVGFRIGVSPDGKFQFDYDHDVFDLIVKSFKRTWIKCYAGWIMDLKNGIFPVKMELFLANTTLLTIIFLAGYDPTFGIMQYLVSWLNWCCSNWLNLTEGLLWVISCLTSAVLTSFFWTGAIRFALRLLFTYQGWMFLSRDGWKKPSILLKLWLVTLQALCYLRHLGSKTKSGKPLLLAFQGSLPTLPLPSVKETVQRHLESVRPLCDDNEFNKFVQLSQEFESTLGKKLQRWLQLKWWTSDNYVSDWWEEYVYLRGRSSLMINSNYYTLDAIKKSPTPIQAARAGNLVHMAFQFRRQSAKQELTPIIVQGIIPMCSAQYDRFFNTTRIPGVETDTIMHLSDSTYVVVMHKGRFFRLCCYNKGQLLNSAELQKQIQGILDDLSPVDEGEEYLGVFTASDRVTWAEARNKFFNKGLNKDSLDIIEKAAFVLVLDEESYGYDPENDLELSRFGAAMLHGKCYNRWFDKSVQIIVGANGHIGLNGEHSWADAPIVGHFWEFVIGNDLGCAPGAVMNYDSEGNCFGSISEVPPKARKLRWDVPQECQNVMQKCLKEAQLLADDLHLHILMHPAYGKGFMKKCNLSPDAYIQMALQLAYYRDAGKFCLTYEASMTRLFREGRTETVRSCTMESSAWARSMDDPDIKDEERLVLLRKACLRHQRGYQEAMTGKGVDRHLFALYVVSKYLNVESEFLKKVLGEPWMLSTSQTPIRGEYNEKGDDSSLLCAGGGFGPVADDGYGVSYVINGENCIFFHVSCKRKCQQTDAYRFAKRIERALDDLRKMHENLNNSNNK